MTEPHIIPGLDDAPEGASDPVAMWDHIAAGLLQIGSYFTVVDSQWSALHGAPEEEARRRASKAAGDLAKLSGQSFLDAQSVRQTLEGDVYSFISELWRIVVPLSLGKLETSPPYVQPLVDVLQGLSADISRILSEGFQVSNHECHPLEPYAVGINPWLKPTASPAGAAAPTSPVKAAIPGQAALRHAYREGERAFVNAWDEVFRLRGKRIYQKNAERLTDLGIVETSLETIRTVVAQDIETKTVVAVRRVLEELSTIDLFGNEAAAKASADDLNIAIDAALGATKRFRESLEASLPRIAAPSIGAPSPSRNPRWTKATALKRPTLTDADMAALRYVARLLEQEVNEIGAFLSKMPYPRTLSKLRAVTIVLTDSMGQQVSSFDRNDYLNTFKDVGTVRTPDAVRAFIHESKQANAQPRRLPDPEDRMVLVNRFRKVMVIGHRLAVEASKLSIGSHIMPDRTAIEGLALQLAESVEVGEIVTAPGSPSSTDSGAGVSSGGSELGPSAASDEHDGDEPSPARRPADDDKLALWATHLAEFLESDSGKFIADLKVAARQLGKRISSDFNIRLKAVIEAAESQLRTINEALREPELNSGLPGMFWELITLLQERADPVANDCIVFVCRAVDVRQNLPRDSWDGLRSAIVALGGLSIRLQELAAWAAGNSPPNPPDDWNPEEAGRAFAERKADAEALLTRMLPPPADAASIEKGLWRHNKDVVRIWRMLARDQGAQPDELKFAASSGLFRFVVLGERDPTGLLLSHACTRGTISFVAQRRGKAIRSRLLKLPGGSRFVDMGKVRLSNCPPDMQEYLKSRLWEHCRLVVVD